MKKLLLILCLFSMTANAQWNFSHSSDNTSVYIDYSRIRTEGRYKSLWHLNDYKLPHTNGLGKQFKSDIAKRIVDCQASRSHLVALYHYSEQMGGGAVVFSANYQIIESDWDYPPPNSIGDSLINIACGRK